MQIILGTLLAVTLLSQPSKISPRGLLRSSGPLTTAQIAVVLSASRLAIAGKTLRLVNSRGGMGPEILMSRTGVPRRVRWSFSIIGGTVGGIVSGSHESRAPAGTTWREDFTLVTEYTGRLARECSAALENGELVRVLEVQMTALGDLGVVGREGLLGRGDPGAGKQQASQYGDPSQARLCDLAPV